MRHGITACRRTAKVIADQLDAMADALQDWDQGNPVYGPDRACSAGKNCV